MSNDQANALFFVVVMNLLTSGFGLAVIWAKVSAILRELKK